MSIEELDTSGGNFFTRSMDRFSEWCRKQQNSASETRKRSGKIERTKEMSDEFKEIDLSKLSDNERKFCKYFTKR